MNHDKRWYGNGIEDLFFTCGEKALATHTSAGSVHRFAQILRQVQYTDFNI